MKFLLPLHSKLNTHLNQDVYSSKNEDKSSCFSSKQWREQSVLNNTALESKIFENDREQNQII